MNGIGSSLEVQNKEGFVSEVVDWKSMDVE
jgi:hypothetical protein